MYPVILFTCLYAHGANLNSVYISYLLYLSCIWNSTAALCEMTLKEMNE